MSKLHLSETSLPFGFAMIALTITTMANLLGVFGDSTIPKQNNGTPQLIHQQWVM
jgi:hypothetical protein